MTDTSDDDFVSYPEALKEVMDRGALNERDANDLLNIVITGDGVQLRDQRPGKLICFSDFSRSQGVTHHSVTVRSDFDVFASDFGRSRVTATPAVSAWDRFKADDAITLNLRQALQAITRRSGVSFTTNASQGSQDQGGAPTPRKVGGRTPIHDWRAMEDDLLVKIDSDGPFKRQADAERWAEDWFQKQSGRTPAESEIRKHVSEVLQRREQQLRRQENQNSKSNKAGN